MTAGHTFYLEELGVQAGDAVSYYARATDNNAVAGPQRATSDMYFLRIRPFNKDFKPAMSMGGGGGGGGGGMDQVGALSQQQRQIIAGTFNMQRDRKQMAADKFREGMTVLTLSQSRLREQVEGLVERMNSRLVTPDPAFQKIAELLPQAAESMKAAEGKLQGQSPDGALPPEQRRCSCCSRPKRSSSCRCRRSATPAGAAAEALARLPRISRTCSRWNWTAWRTSTRPTSAPASKHGDQRIDELAEKLKELARRQEQELERQRRMAAGQAPRGNSNDLQRALAEQAEEAARQLERLSRDQNRQDLANTARQLRDAADAMRRAASNGDASAQGQAAAAAERLREAQRQLQRSQGDRAEPRRPGRAAAGRGDRARAEGHRRRRATTCPTPAPIESAARRWSASARTRSSRRSRASSSSSIAWRTRRPRTPRTCRASSRRPPTASARTS